MGKYNKINSQFEEDVVFNTYKVKNDAPSVDPLDLMQTGTINKASRGSVTLFDKLDFEGEGEVILEFLYPHKVINGHRNGIQVSYSTTEHAYIHHVTFFNKGDDGTVQIHLKGLEIHAPDHTHDKNKADLVDKKGVFIHIDVNIKHPPGGDK